MSVCIRVMLSLCIPPAPRPCFKAWRRIKLLLHYTITILTSMASDRVVSINSRTTVQSIPMAVFPNVARPDGWTSWADQGFSVAIFSSVFPYRRCWLCFVRMRECTQLLQWKSADHTSGECAEGVVERKPQNWTDTSKHWNEWEENKQGTIAKPWISVQFKLQHGFSVTLIYRYRNNSCTEITKAMTWPLGEFIISVAS